MKYESLKNSDLKNITISVQNMGVNLSDNNGNFAENNLKFCKNIWNKNGILETRPGLSCEESNIIGKAILKENVNYESRFTDAEIYIDGKYHKITVSNVFYSNSAFFAYVSLVDEDRNITDIGALHFARTDTDTFYVPENITFYVGKSENGGIFALITLVNMVDFKSRNYHVFEINKDFTAWNKVMNYYVPTVYINGRGDSFDLAKKAGVEIEASPKALEALNMLDGRFYAYYSSDGYSSSFRLPFSKLSEEAIRCRLYLGGGGYAEWCVLSDSTSDTLKLHDVDITLVLDREKGIITFYSDGSEFAIPQMLGYKENNIRVFAKKDIPEAFERVVSCKQNCTVNSKNVFSGGIGGSEVYFSNYDNPLYFPMVSGNLIGLPSNEVVALIPFGDRVVAFKNDEIHSLQIEDSKPINSTNLLIDNPAIFHTESGLKIKTVSDNLGCAFKSTIAKIGERLIWVSGEGDVCSYTNGNITVISNPIKAYLTALLKENSLLPVAVSFGDYYMLCCGSKAVLAKWNAKSDFSWFIWELPEDCNICGAFSYKGNPTFLCTDNSNSVYCIADLKGYKDNLIHHENEEIKVSYHNINSQIETKKYRLSPLGKAVKVSKIYLDLKSQGNTEIKVLGEENLSLFRLSETDVCAKSPKTVKLVPNLKCRRGISLSIESRKPIKLGPVEIYFSTIN